MIRFAPKILPVAVSDILVPAKAIVHVTGIVAAIVHAIQYVPLIVHVIGMACVIVILFVTGIKL